MPEWYGQVSLCIALQPRPAQSSHIKARPWLLKNNSSFFLGTVLRKSFQEPRKHNNVPVAHQQCCLRIHSLIWVCPWQGFWLHALWPRDSLSEAYVTCAGPCCMSSFCPSVNWAFIVNSVFMFLLLSSLSLSKGTSWPLSVTLIFPAKSQYHRCKGKSKKLPKWGISSMVTSTSWGCWKEMKKMGMKHFKVQRNVLKGHVPIIKRHKGRKRASLNSEIEPSEIT